MAKNQYGFISKRYPQPLKYDLIFSDFCAIYCGKDGREYMIEGVPSHLSTEKLGATIDHYCVLVREPDCRRTIRGNIKTQKECFEVLGDYVNLN